jgi:ABC-type sugar transport system ATPase subunit
VPSIKLENLSYSFKKKKEIFNVLNDISLEFETNKIHVILGASGSGKTTLLKCISGLYDYEGHIYFDDILMDQVPTKDRKLGYITQEFALYPHYDLFHSISYPLIINGTDIDEIRKRTYEISEEFGIRDILSRKPKQVSIGQAQRATLARAMIKRPTICLLDEPLSNVDQQNRQELRLFIKKTMIKNGTTAIYVTHDLEEATAIGDYLYLLDEGQIIIKGTVNDVLFSKNSKVKEFFESLKNEAF